MKKRDRRPITPSHTSLMGEKSGKQSTLFDDDFNCDAVPESIGTTVKPCDTSSAFYLKGEGTSKKKEEEKEKSKYVSESGNKDKSYNSGVFPPNPKNNIDVFGPDNKKLKNTNESRAIKWVKNKKAEWLEDKLGKDRKAIRLFNPPLGRRKDKQTRVPVLAPDGEPLMPTISSKARKWIKQGKAKVFQNDMGIFQIQLINEPSGRAKQQIVLLNDPGSRFTGVAVCSKKHILYGCNLELIADKKKNKFASIKYRMDKRRELRRSRRYRNCRRRPSRFLNRSKTGKMAPSIRSRKQLELRANKELCNIYPISIIGLEDVKFDHYSKRWGKNFSQIEVGKKWLYEEMKKLVSDVRLLKGFETNTRRQQLKLKKSSKKEERDPSSHVNDCIAMGSIVLGLGINTKTILSQGINFNIITRPKYSRRKLHNEQPNKDDKRITKNGHRKRRRFGGTTTDWTKIRKGDYIEAIIDKRDGNDMMYRGWVGGFENDRKFISLYNFDWKVIGQFDSKNVRLLKRNNGLMIKSLYVEDNRINICKLGTKQKGIDGSDFKKIEKEKKDNSKKFNQINLINIKLDKTIQKGILDAW